MMSEDFFVFMPQFNNATTSLSSHHALLNTTSSPTINLIQQQYYTGDIITGTTANTSLGRSYLFQIKKKGKYLIATCEELSIKVQGTTKDILVRKANEAVALLRGGSTIEKKYLTLWGTHNG